jgi:beta-glucanase (GH16 family)
VAFLLCGLSGAGLAKLQHQRAGAAHELAAEPSLKNAVAGKSTTQPSAVKPKTDTLRPPKTSAGSTTSGASARGNEVAQGLLWQEDFTHYSAAQPSAAYWNIADRSLPIYNNEAQVYSPSMVRVSDGALLLEAQKQGNSVISGRVDSKHKLTISSGTRLTARIRLPKGRGTWPAFWLLSDNQPYTSRLHPTIADWEAERFYMWDGEVDIMESYGRYNAMVEGTLHTFDQSFEKDQALSNPDGWHTYWLEWRADSMTMGVDDLVYVSYPKGTKPTSSWPFGPENKYYIILNLAMGGDGGGPIIQAPSDRWQMQVARVAAYKL